MNTFISTAASTNDMFHGSSAVIAASARLTAMITGSATQPRPEETQRSNACTSRRSISESDASTRSV
jgi:hypothetical protein